MSANNFPAISGVSIRANDNGLFNLNDLHKAAGGNDRHRPKFFFENERTARIVRRLKETTATDPVVISVGAKGGTYANIDLVYSYAMWISEDFHLQVVRAFHAILIGDHARADTEARKAVALWEDAKKNGFPARDADWMIARLLGKQEEFEREEQERAQIEGRKQAEWRNTVEGFVATRFEKVQAGYQENINVPDQLDVANVEREIERFMKKRGVACRFIRYGRRSICVETC